MLIIRSRKLLFCNLALLAQGTNTASMNNSLALANAAAYYYKIRILAFLKFCISYFVTRVQ